MAQAIFHCKTAVVHYFQLAIEILARTRSIKPLWSCQVVALELAAHLMLFIRMLKLAIDFSSHGQSFIWPVGLFSESLSVNVQASLLYAGPVYLISLTKRLKSWKKILWSIRIFLLVNRDATKKIKQFSLKDA